MQNWQVKGKENFFVGWQALTSGGGAAFLVPLKIGSRIFNYRPPNRILQIFGSGQQDLLAAPAGAARKEWSRKIKRRNKIKGNDFFGNKAVRQNKVLYDNFWKYEGSKIFISNFSPSIPPVAELRRFFQSLAEHLLLTHAKIYEHNTTTNKIFSLHP